MMKNEYEIRGDVTAIFLNSPKYGKMETLISTNKLALVQEFTNTWYPWWSVRSKTFYARGNRPETNGIRGTVKLHRLVTDCPAGMAVDHINHNGLINTDENLRVLTIGENSQNMRGATASNRSSGIRGVTYHKRMGKWAACIGINSKRFSLGYFDDIDAAELAVKQARAKFMPYSLEAMSGEHFNPEITLSSFHKKRPMDSGIEGITWVKHRKKWEVRYRYAPDRPRIRLGCFATVEEAHDALKQYQETLAQ